MLRLIPSSGRVPHPIASSCFAQLICCWARNTRQVAHHSRYEPSSPNSDVSVVGRFSRPPSRPISITLMVVLLVLYRGHAVVVGAAPSAGTSIFHTLRTFASRMRDC